MFLDGLILFVNTGRLRVTLSAVVDLRDFRPLASPEELEAFEVDVLAGFVLARASAGLADGTIRGMW